MFRFASVRPTRQFLPRPVVARRHFAVQQPGPDQRHFRRLPLDPGVWENPIHHAVWSKEEVVAIQKTHVDPQGFVDNFALFGVKLCRWAFDTFSGYRFGALTTEKVIRRAIFLETVAGVPGFAGAIIRHLSSLRNLRRDHGWIHTLLEEAENERMHLLTFIELKQPGILFRAAVLITQGLFMNIFFLAYLIYPRICHRFVGYLEEEAVKTYTDILAAIDDGRLSDWKNKDPPPIAMAYWRLPAGSTFKDMIYAIRADEANHRDVNHTFADIGPDQTNPFITDPKGGFLKK